MKQIHIEQLIEKPFSKKKMAVVEFTKLLGNDRQVAYIILKRKSVKTDLLEKVREILEHDFFQYYSASLKVKKGLKFFHH